MDQKLIDRTIMESYSTLPFPLSMDFIEIWKRLGDLDMFQQVPLLQRQSITALNIAFRSIAARKDQPHVSVSCLGALDLVPHSWRNTVQCFLRNCKTGQFFLEVIVSDCHAFFEKNCLMKRSGVFLRVEFRPSKWNRCEN